MTDESEESASSRSFRFEWGGVQFEVRGSDSVVQEGFKLLESEILPRIDSTSIPPPAESQPDREEVSSDGEPEQTPTPKEFMADKDPSAAYEKATALAYYAKIHRGMDVMTSDKLDRLITESQVKDFKASDALYNAERNAGYMENLGSGSFELTQSGIRYVQNELGTG